MFHYVSIISLCLVSGITQIAIMDITVVAARYRPTMSTLNRVTSHVAMKGAMAAPRIDARLYAIHEPV